MSHIKGSNTKPEILVRKFLFSKGLRYRLHDRKLPGTPDIKLTKYKTVIFINGCFWHGHQSCKSYRMPKSNVEFWNSKIERNSKRDIETKKNLNKLGWSIIVIWQCQLKKNIREKTLMLLQKNIICANFFGK